MGHQTISSHSLKHKGKLYADFHGGYAMSSDNGSTWEWIGGSIGGNVVSDASVMVRINDPVFSAKSVEYSDDGGSSWKPAMKGIPGYNNQSGFTNYGQVYVTNNTIYLDAFEDGRKLVKFNTTTKEWEPLNDNSSLPENVALLGLTTFNSTLYANLEDQGVWKMGSTSTVASSRLSPVSAFPNPTSNLVFLGLKLDRMKVTNALGKEVMILYRSSDLIDLTPLPPGTYTITGISDSRKYFTRIIKL